MYFFFFFTCKQKRRKSTKKKKKPTRGNIRALPRTPCSMIIRNLRKKSPLKPLFLYFSLLVLVKSFYTNREPLSSVDRGSLFEKILTFSLNKLDLHSIRVFDKSNLRPFRFNKKRWSEIIQTMLF